MAININAVVGLDLSVRSAGLVKDSYTFGEKIKTHVIGTDIDFGTDMERFRHSCDAIVDLVDTFDIVFLENYSFMSTGRDRMLAELAGIVKYSLWLKTGIAPIVVSPQTLKKFVLGSGKGQKKDMIKLGAYKKWGVEFETDDETDAFCLARLGCMIVGLEEPKYEYEKECIKAILSPPKKTKGKGKKKVTIVPPNIVELERVGVLNGG